LTPEVLATAGIKDGGRSAGCDGAVADDSIGTVNELNQNAMMIASQSGVFRREGLCFVIN
jgi:hypothetical protein